MPNDIRQKKLRVSLWIMALGMLLGLIWAGCQGWALGRGYPANTILSNPEYRFTDYLNFLRACAMSSPYREPYAIYFPGAYLCFRPVTWIDLADSYVAFVASILTVGILMLDAILREFLKKGFFRSLVALALVFLSYPIWICIDRGNIEMLLGLLVAVALVLLSQRRYALATIVLSLTICMKLYTILLLALFFRRAHYKYIVGAMILFGSVSLIALSTFSGSLRENYAAWRHNFTFYNQQYLIFNDGIAGSASVWNLLKATFLTFYQLTSTPNWGHLLAYITLLLSLYKVGFLLVTAFVVYTVTLVERQFFRRAVLLLLLITTAAPNGGDYKLVYIDLALVVFILIPSCRIHDLRIAGLLAFVLIPKKELFLGFLGPSDTHFLDVDIGVLLNPLCILIAGALLIHDCWRERVPQWGRKRALVLLSPLRNLILFGRSRRTLAKGLT
jgi:hypothetical protein